MPRKRNTDYIRKIKVIVELLPDLHDFLYQRSLSLPLKKNHGKLNRMILEYIQKGIDHERDLEESGFRQVGVQDWKPKSIGNVILTKKVSKEELKEMYPEVPICHGSPMLDYGTHYFCLVGNHKEVK